MDGRAHKIFAGVQRPMGFRWCIWAGSSSFWWCKIMVFGWYVCRRNQIPDIPTSDTRHPAGAANQHDMQRTLSLDTFRCHFGVVTQFYLISPSIVVGRFCPAILQSSVFTHNYHWKFYIHFQHCITQYVRNHTFIPGIPFNIHFSSFTVCTSRHNAIVSRASLTLQCAVCTPRKPLNLFRTLNFPLMNLVCIATRK